MAVTGLEVFDTTVQTTNTWLNELGEKLGVHEHQRTYEALRAVLHALRDRLTVEETAHLGAQLPMLIRGIYYEAWRPTTHLTRERHKQQFLDHVGEALPFIASTRSGFDPESVVRAVFALLAERISEGEIRDVKQSLPAELRALWP